MGHKPLTSHRLNPFSQLGLESQLEDQGLSPVVKSIFQLLVRAARDLGGFLFHFPGLSTRVLPPCSNCVRTRARTHTHRLGSRWG